MSKNWFRRREGRFLTKAPLLVLGDGKSALAQVGLRDAVVPAQVVFVEDGPGEAQADGQHGKRHGTEAPAELRTGWAFVVESAQRDAGIAHTGCGDAKGEEKRVVEEAGEDEADDAEQLPVRGA